MTNILNPGQVTVIGGIASQYQSAIARELVFADVVSERHPVAIFMSDNDEAPHLHFKVWRRARHKPNSGEGRIHVTDALHSARDMDDFIQKLDKLWRYLPGPLIVNDTSHRTFTPDRWSASWASEIARIFRAKVVNVTNMGVHPLIAAPLTDIRADARFEVSADDLRVTVKNLATGEATTFLGRAVDGGLVFDAKEREAAHA